MSRRLGLTVFLVVSMVAGAVAFGARPSNYHALQDAPPVAHGTVVSNKDLQLWGVVTSRDELRDVGDPHLAMRRAGPISFRRGSRSRRTAPWGLP